jgi:hypothetical protein
MGSHRSAARTEAESLDGTDLTCRGELFCFAAGSDQATLMRRIQDDTSTPQQRTSPRHDSECHGLVSRTAIHSRVSSHFREVVRNLGPRKLP